jgi:SNF2 family DNA or RNA helicase
MTLKPHAYQLRWARFLVEHSFSALFADPGLGKTLTFLLAFQALEKARFVKSALIVAPLRTIVSSWPDEIARWAPHLSFKIIHGSNKAEALASNAQLKLINYDGLLWLSAQSRKRLPEMVCFDESTKLKHGQTQRFKAIKTLLPHFKRRVIMTGTPAAQGLEDLWAQIYLLDEGRTLGRYITHFRRRWFVPTDPYGWQWAPRATAGAEIMAQINPYTIRAEAKDYLDLPKLHEVERRFALPTKAAALYEKLEKDFLLELRNGSITAINAAVKVGKMRQFTSGWVYTDDRAVMHVHKAKLEALQDLVEELSGQPLIVVYGYLHERDALAKHFGAPFIGGGVTPTRTREIIADWNAGKLPVLLLFPSHGLNLQAGGHHMAFYTHPWSYELYKQTTDRLHRQGQKSAVTIHHMIAEDSIDKTVLYALRAKANKQSQWLDLLRNDLTKRRG